LSESEYLLLDSVNLDSLKLRRKQKIRCLEEVAKAKIEKKRQVKEGSPFEEDFLIDMLKEEVRVTQHDKDEVKDIMKALLHFGMITESTEIHSLINKLIKA